MTYKESGIDNTIVFKVDKIFSMNMAGALASGTLKARQEYMKDHLEAMKPENAANSNIDIPDQIKKLSELKDQEIITEKEFEDKKKELLDKM